MLFFEELTQNALEELLLPLSAARLSRSHPLSEEDAERKRRVKARYRAKQIYNWVYHRGVVSWDGMSDLSKELRDWLKQNVAFYPIELVKEQVSIDGTRKFLWKMQDGNTIESVLIPVESSDLADPSDDGADGGEREESVVDSILTRAAGATALPVASRGRVTACVSSQVGCAMNCQFCVTARQKLTRNLTAAEIVAQVRLLKTLAPVTNLVFMGMGEPLHNFDHVTTACQILLSQDGLGFSKRRITVSTAGLVTQIDLLGKTIDVSLAVSLNATTDEQRSQIMPVNQLHPISDLLAACRRYPLGSHRKITFEYVMLKGFNDTLEDAARLVQLIRNIPCKVNLLPFNEHAMAEFKRPSDETVRAFHQYLAKRGVTTIVRLSRGRDISAACGQLKSLHSSGDGRSLSSE